MTSSRALVPLLLLALLSGCYSMRAQVPGALRGDLRDEQVIVQGRVDVEVSRLYFFWGLLPAGDESDLAVALREAVARERADGVANLVFESHFTTLDVFIQLVSLGVVVPRSYRLRGDVVRIEAEPLPGRPLLRAGDLDRRRAPPSPPAGEGRPRS